MHETLTPKLKASKITGTSADFSVQKRMPLVNFAAPAVSIPAEGCEQEADRIAAQVMQYTPEQSPQPSAESRDGHQKYQQPGPSPTGVPSGVPLLSGMGDGHPLPAETREFFEPRFGHSLAAVRIHTSDRAAETANSLNARAFTIGSNVAFAAGQFAPQNSSAAIAGA